MATTYGIFFNNNAGDGKAKDAAELLKRKLMQQSIDSKFISGEDAQDSENKLIEALPKLEGLVAIGGDGTLNLAMTGLIKAKSKVPFGVIPSGTVNNFAKRFEIPQNIDAAIEVILGNRKKLVGIAKCDNNQAIVSSLTIGNLADLSNEVRQKDKQKLGKIVYLLEAIKRIGKNKSYLIEYNISGKRKKLKTWFALLTTTSSIGGHIYSDSAPGKLHLSILNNINIKQIIPYIYFSLTGKLNNSKSITYLTMDKICLKSLDQKKVVARIDGDEGPELPLEITYLDDFLNLFVPKH